MDLYGTLAPARSEWLLRSGPENGDEGKSTQEAEHFVVYLVGT